MSFSLPGHVIKWRTGGAGSARCFRERRLGLEGLGVECVGVGVPDEDDGEGGSSSHRSKNQSQKDGHDVEGKDGWKRKEQSSITVNNFMHFPIG